jgi:hypothetical protein
MAGTIPAISDRKVRNQLRADGITMFDTATVPVVCEQHPATVGGNHGLSNHPRSAGCDESRTSGEEGGSEKRAGSNPGIELRRGSTQHYREGNQTAIWTLLERNANYTVLVHLPHGYKAKQMRHALTAKIKTLPETVHQSLT